MFIVDIIILKVWLKKKKNTEKWQIAIIDQSTPLEAETSKENHALSKVMKHFRKLPEILKKVQLNMFIFLKSKRKPCHNSGEIIDQLIVFNYISVNDLLKWSVKTEIVKFSQLFKSFSAISLEIRSNFSILSLIVS